ncbi:MAG: alpha-L-fucosidase, partial [Planctomycetales bacterium]|nr:alpha-L-fucosidase [Planctomycetales bacterium]
WWRDARFGMFIHWGVYAVPAGSWHGQEFERIGEWIMDTADIPVDQYEPLAGQFAPTAYDPREWARMAKGAGAKYVVITSKHHDGFCLFDTDATDWDVVDASPYSVDLLTPLSEACRAEGIKFGVYYSIMDWHHPAQQRGGEHYNPTKIRDGRKREYVEYMKRQLGELLDSCDPDVLWFDGEWLDWWTDEDGREIYDFLLERKPTIIVNNRVGKARSYEGEQNAASPGDFGTPEQRIPATGMPGVDWESCMTINDTWGFKTSDTNWKSTKTLIRNLVDIASKGGNYLLNVGPTAEGRIPEASVERLAEMGQWLRVNGESIYGTTASPFAAAPWGRATRRVGDATDEIYLHVFDWPNDGKLKVPSSAGDMQSATLLSSGEQLEVATKANDRVVIQVPTKAPDPIDTVVKLVVRRVP